MEEDLIISEEDLELAPYDIVEFLDNEESYSLHLKISLEENGIDGFLKAINNVARAKMISDLATLTNSSYQHIYEILSKGGKVSAEMLADLLKAFNIQLNEVSS